MSTKKIFHIQLHDYVYDLSNQLTPFDDEFKLLLKTLLVRKTFNYRNNTDFIRDNITQFILNIIILRESIRDGKRNKIIPLLNNIKNDSSTIVATSRTENRETVAILRENFKTKIALLVANIELWLSDRK